MIENTLLKPVLVKIYETCNFDQTHFYSVNYQQPIVPSLRVPYMRLSVKYEA